jgi:phage gp46-like protein
MPRDIKLTQNKISKNWDISFEKGDFALTEGLDTALYLSVLGEVRASSSQVENPVLRRGHFTNEFSNVEGYEIGSLLWFFSQLPNTEENKTLAEDSIRNGIQWMLSDAIVADAVVSVEKTRLGLNVAVNLTNEQQQQGNYFDLFVKTFN